jgi:hypothetical protein
MIDAAAEAKGTDRPSLAAVVIAWTFVGAWVATLGWSVLSEPIYVNPASSLPLQLLVGMLASLPSGYATWWLARVHHHRISSWFGPRDESKSDGKRRSLLVAVDIAAWLFIVIFVGAGVWILGGWKLTFVSSLGKMPVQLLVAFIDVVPFAFGVVWLIFRNAKRITDALERL